MAYIGDVSKEGLYYFPAVSILINPTTFQINDYTVYLGILDLNNHGNGSNVVYRPISILSGCKPYMDACIDAFQRFALDPSSGEPSGGIQDWALSNDGLTLNSFFGIENALFKLDINTLSTNCIAGPLPNSAYTGMTGAMTDEFGGIYFQGGTLFGLQVDRGRLFSINMDNGALTLVSEGLPKDFRGDNAGCYDCGNTDTNPINSASINVCPRETTTYTVTVTNDKGCKNSASVTVTVRDLPNPTITGKNILCIGESTTLTGAGGTSYLWSNGDISASIHVSPIVTTTYGLTVTDANGCKGTSSYTVTVHPLPNVAILGNSSICQGESIGMIATGGVLYQWSNGATTANILVSPTVNTTYTVTVTDINGCNATQSKTVTVHSLPVANVIGNSPICQGESTLLTASGGVSYGWNNGETTAAISVSPNTSTSYTVTVTNSNGCKSTFTKSVSVHPLPIAAISGNSAICNGDSTMLTGSGGITYVWSTGATTSVISVNPVVLTTYTVTITDTNGCTSSTSKTVNINASPDLTIAGNGSICIGESTSLSVAGGVSYMWSNGATTSSISVSPTSTTIYSVTVTNSSGCIGAFTKTVIVHTLPQALITGTDTICLGASTTLTASGGNSYLWNTGATTANITVSPLSNNVYSVTVTNTNGCTSTSTKTVIVNPLPNPNILGNNSLCLGETITLTASGGSMYHWSNGATTASIAVSPIANTIYLVTVTDSNGCSASTSKSIILNASPNATITGSSAICVGSGVTLTAGGGTSYVWNTGATTTTISAMPVVTTTYAVTVTNAFGCTATASKTVSINSLPIITISGVDAICNGESTTLQASGGNTYIWNSGESTASISVSPSNNTTYTVTATDANGCVAIASKTVTIHAIPAGSISGNNVLCAGETTTLTASGGSIYTWNNGSSTASISVNPTATTTYTVTVTDQNGCKANTRVTVTVNPLPVITIVGNESICHGENTTLQAFGGGSYAWSTGSATASITINPLVTTSYTVTVVDSKGCSATKVATVNVYPMPIATINGASTVCIGSSTTLTATGGTQYLWNTGATSSAINVSPNTSTTYTVTVIDAKGCRASTSKTVEPIDLPIVNISGVDGVCESVGATLTATGGGTYLWSNGATTASISFTPTSTATYTVTVTNEQGCTATSSKMVKLKSRPILNVNGLHTICKGDSAFIVATGMTSNDCPGVCSIIAPQVLAYWNLDSCKAVMNLGTHLTYDEFVPVTNKANCTGVTASTVHRLPGNKHSCTIGPNGSIALCISSQQSCSPAKADYSKALRFEVVLNPAQSGQITGLQFFEQAPQNYTWVDGGTGLNNYATKYLIRVSKDGQYIYYKDQINTNRTWKQESYDFSNNPNFKTLTTAKYLFELIPYCTINNGGLESVWDIDEIKVLGGCCQGTANEISSYAWSNGSTGTSITVKPSVDSKYKVTVTDCCGCTNVAEYDVFVSNLMADLGPDRMINLGESATLTPTISGATVCSTTDPNANKVKYLWSTGATTATMVVTPSVSTFYRVTVTDCNDCVDTETISIHINQLRPLIVYPNPANGMFNISAVDGISPDIKVRIFSADGRNIVMDKPDIISNNVNNVSIMIPNQFQSGLYIVEIINGDKIYTEKLILLR
ncbi:MAG: T9SS type A sorting domain-containing protein [Saprospiraceae bacterium]